MMLIQIGQQLHFEVVNNPPNTPVITRIPFWY